MKRLAIVIVVLLGGCKFEDEQKACPEYNDHGKAECLAYGATYVEIPGHIYCLTKGGMVMERK